MTDENENTPAESTPDETSPIFANLQSTEPEGNEDVAAEENDPATEQIEPEAAPADSGVEQEQAIAAEEAGVEPDPDRDPEDDPEEDDSLPDPTPSIADNTDGIGLEPDPDPFPAEDSTSA